MKKREGTRERNRGGKECERDRGGKWMKEKEKDRYSDRQKM
jgi:hypothetical protein